MNYPKEIIDKTNCRYTLIDFTDKFIIYSFLSEMGICGWILIKAGHKVEFDNVEHFGKYMFSFVSKKFMYSFIKENFDVEYKLPEDREE